MSPKKSTPKKIVNYKESPRDIENINIADLPCTFEFADQPSCSTFTVPLDSDSITSDSLLSTSTLHQVKDQKKQDEIFQSDECSDNIEKFEEHSQQKDAAKSSLESSGVFFRKKGKRNDNIVNHNITSDIIDHFIDNVQVQEEIRVKLDHMEVKLDRILRKLFPEEVKLKRPHGIPAFPLRTEKEWNTLEDILADDNIFTYVVDVFAAKIKNQESEVAAVQSVLPKIITNSLARCISWGGTQKTKIAFNSSKTYEAIQATILQKFGNKADLDKPENYVKCWFSTSAQRVV
ncbi:uncharacterized protein [Linepithema humile]|uniref:uncharacterized protein isoform X2 n=1 Tax=Linepithema humile TaxID=83485 RepID=UPI00062350B9|nr:PREDICTED: uncharacterized protein LOC105669272 [Linepithema humile]XP_012217568.1 PREDICTED: uncharacterized protein LOC105669272 [Linepithema humile]